MELRRRGEVDERLFAETRLRRGVYGQRYDNGQRHDGTQTRELEYRDHPTKGPETVWDAPGMVRIKIPYGKMSSEQIDADGRAVRGLLGRHLTRDDSAGHPASLRPHRGHAGYDAAPRIASGITTREACGNSVRNITACHLAGVCKTETFDVTPYAEALKDFLLGHPDVQDFGRKMKPAFSGCAHEACGLVNMHDVGYIAKAREVDGSGAARLRVLRRRWARCDSASGPAPDGVRDRGGVASAHSGCLPRLRASRREGQSGPSTHQVPSRQARHRGVPQARLRREGDAPCTIRSWTAYLKDVAEYREEPVRDGGLARGERGALSRPSGRGTPRTCGPQRQDGYSVGPR